MPVRAPRLTPLIPLLALGAAACASPPAAPATPKALATSPPSQRARFHVLGKEASAIEFGRIAKYPEPGWHVPHAIGWSPDGATLTFLASESLDDEMALFSFDRATKKASVLLRASDLPGGAKPRSREEELRRERQRQRTEGITSYRWAKRANVLVIPNGGDVFVRDAGGKIGRLTDTPEPEIDPKACPSGEKVAFVRKGELVSIDVATKRETTLTRGALEGFTHGLSDFVAQEELGEPSGFFWSPRCDRIAYLEVDERKVATVPVLGWRDAKADLMQQRYPETGGINPAVRLGIVDLSTKQTVWVKWPDASERYLVRFAWSDDGKNLYLQSLSRDHRKSALVRVDPASGATTELFAETASTWVWPSASELLSKTPEIVWTSESTGHRHLEVRKLEPGARPRALTEGAWDVISLVAVDEERGRVLFTATKDGALERHLYAVPLAGGPITNLTAARGVHAISSDERGRSWVDVSSAHDRLPRADVVVDDQKIGELQVPLDADFDKLRIRPVELVTLRGPSGIDLHGALLRPRIVAPGEKHPAIVMVYGGPGHQAVVDSWSARLLWQHLADRGFFVFQLDNRGTPGRGVAFERATYGKLGEVELEDQLAGAEWLAHLPEVDPSRIGIHGHSYGGFMTALAMTKAPGRFAAGVAGSPVVDWRTYDTGYTERFMGTPAANPDGYATSDVTRYAAGLTGRLFIVHANMDENVHYANTAKLVDALVNAGKTFDLLVFPGERHGYRRPAARAYVNERVATFFAEAL